jgi:cold-inducible RNA-binding protein
LKFFEGPIDRNKIKFIEFGKIRIYFEFIHFSQEGLIYENYYQYTVLKVYTYFYHNMIEYAKLTVVQLKAALKKRKLSTGGKKADLVARLEQNDSITLANGKGKDVEKARKTKDLQVPEERNKKEETKDLNSNTTSVTSVSSQVSSVSVAPTPVVLSATSSAPIVQKSDPEPSPEVTNILPEELRHAVKLFVGQIPSHTTREELEPLFQSFGKVLNVHIIQKNNRVYTNGTNGPAASAFVTYKSYDDAKCCIDQLHNQVTLEEGHGPLQVSLATGEGERLGLSEFSEDKKVVKLFFGMLPYSYGKKEILSLLCPTILSLEDVDDVFIIRKNGGSGDPTGCAFVRIRGEKNAQSVIDSLSEKITLPGAPNKLNVSFAAVKKSSRSSSSSLSRNRPAVEVLGVKRPRNFSSENVQQQQQNKQQYLPPPHQRMRIQGQSIPFSSFSSSSSNSMNQPFYKLHVANLAFHVAESDLSTLFGKFGRIIEVFILRDRASGRSKGAAFIKFANKQDAEMAIIQVNGTLQWGFEKPLRVSFADKQRNAPRVGLSHSGRTRPQQYYAPMPTPMYQQHCQQQSANQSFRQQFLPSQQAPPHYQQNQLRYHSQQQQQNVNAPPRGPPPKMSSSSSSSDVYNQWGNQPPSLPPPSIKSW